MTLSHLSNTCEYPTLQNPSLDLYLNTHSRYNFLIQKIEFSPYSAFLPFSLLISLPISHFWLITLLTEHGLWLLCPIKCYRPNYKKINMGPSLNLAVSWALPFQGRLGKGRSQDKWHKSIITGGIQKLYRAHEAKLSDWAKFKVYP